jgi:hypothetical protein
VDAGVRKQRKSYRAIGCDAHLAEISRWQSSESKAGEGQFFRCVRDLELNRWQPASFFLSLLFFAFLFFSAPAIAFRINAVVDM